MNWWKDLKGRVRQEEPLKNHTTFKIGGTAKFFIEPKDLTDLRLLLQLAKRHKVPLLVIGRGSNILADNQGIAAAVIRLSAAYFKKISFKNNYLEAGSGADLSQIILSAQKQGLSGLEFLAGIPGSVGGAVMMNAGAQGASIADFIENVRVMDYNDKLRILEAKECKFGYRASGLGKYIILGLRLKLFRKDKQEIKNRIKEYLDYRRVTQDLSRPSAGCVFKNPGMQSAGKLIDLCHLKGKRVGNAMISKKHANFILNLDSAKSSDVLNLMRRIKKEVKEKFNILLEPEIKIWK